MEASQSFAIRNVISLHFPKHLKDLSDISGAHAMPCPESPSLSQDARGLQEGSYGRRCLYNRKDTTCSQTHEFSNKVGATFPRKVIPV